MVHFSRWYLFDCEKEEVTQRDIEKGLNLRNPTVTGLLKRLDEKGYILSVPSNTDKRCKNIYLTEKAYDIQRRMENQRRKLDKMLTIGMNKKEIEALEKMLNIGRQLVICMITIIKNSRRNIYSTRNSHFWTQELTRRM